MTNLQGLEVIGYFCWWSINDAKISYTDLQRNIDELGIDYKVPKPHIRSAFLKAVREVQALEKSKKLMIRKISKTSEAYKFGLVDESVDRQTDALSYAHQATLEFDPVNGNMSTTKPHRAYAMVKERYEEYREKLTSEDIRDTFLKIVVAAKSISVRPRGGFYFVHDTYRDLVAKLEKLAVSLPGDNTFMVAPQIDTDRSKKAIYKGFIESLKTRIENFNKEIDEDTLVRKGAWNARLTEFKDMRKEIAFYRDAMQFHADDLSDALTAMATKVEAKLSSMPTKGKKKVAA